jgi:hypothetical protein
MKTIPEIDEIWLKEAESRLKAYREGKTKGISAEEVVGEPNYWLNRIRPK